jgi:hypothetical protein
VRWPRPEVKSRLGSSDRVRARLPFGLTFATGKCGPGKSRPNVQPVYVSIANRTTSPRLESSGEIFALGADGNRLPALTPREAANQAGNSAGLASSVETAAAYCTVGRGSGRPLPPSDPPSWAEACSAAA